MIKFRNDEKFLFKENNDKRARKKRGIFYEESDEEFEFRSGKKIFRENNKEGTRVFLGIRVVNWIMRIPTFVETEEEFMIRIYNSEKDGEKHRDTRSPRII